jgi:hypothetical protein
LTIQQAEELERSSFGSSIISPLAVPLILLKIINSVQYEFLSQVWMIR